MNSFYRRLNVLSRAVVVSLILSCGAGHAWAGVDLGNIMPLGDSITQGAYHMGAYRDPLYTKLAASGFTFRFVGSSNATATPLLEKTGNAWHEGHSGFVIGEANNQSRRAGIYENLDRWIAPLDPQIILLMIGTNDALLNYRMASAPDRLSQLITKITHDKPQAYVIVAQITPLSGKVIPDSKAAEALAETYNAAIPGIVAAHRALGEKVTMVDMHSALDAKGTDTHDGIHPNLDGDAKMAEVWLSGIKSLLHTGRLP